MIQPAMYILANRRHGTLYVGSTTDLLRRVWEHKSRQVPGFTERYGVDHLVYFECHAIVGAAAMRERRVKRWRRIWKVELIEVGNPDWNDLFDGLLAL